MTLPLGVRWSWVLVAMLPLSIGACGSKSGGSSAPDASSDVTGTDSSPPACPLSCLQGGGD